MFVVDLEPYWYIQHLKSGRHKVRNIGDRVFSKLYDIFKNQCYAFLFSHIEIPCKILFEHEELGLTCSLPSKIILEVIHGTNTRWRYTI